MKKTFGIVKKVFTAIVAAMAVFMMIFTVISVATFNRNDRNIFGFKAFVVLSDSMKATDFAAGDVIIVKSVEPESLAEGDIIAFSSQDIDNFGETITHKIRKRAVNADGEEGFVTYGTTTGVDDKTIVTYPYINGKYVFNLPKVGKFFSFLKTTPGYIICILVPFLLLIGIQGLNTIKLFKRYKSEQLEEINAEHAKLEEERKQSEAMLAELQALKAQVAAQNKNDGDSSPQ